MQRAAHKNKCAYQERWRNSWLHLRDHGGFYCLKIREKKKKIMVQVCEQQALQQAQWQQQQQLLLILQSSLGNLSFSSNTLLLREDKEMSRAAPSTFRAKEEEIKRKKMEICDCFLSHLGRIKEETKRLATIHKQNGSVDDGGEYKAAEEQETGNGEADEARHRVWSGRHYLCPGTSSSFITICFWLLHWQLVWLFCIGRNSCLC
ncbi:hypothetical protein EUGRSUZ_I00611 [Eucalyptus grandis]|uniref:Uncharacterized protein n=3 Tax=Eucalyptus grandis TaxID=71139 RepID=A0A059ALU8_EUCGR|nr:hypothetical protein EUGRSUZ_I00611 [Eucalyptus grandis]KAK3411859.1 hypothetical protein EUGRSUZ_I00611 [Eucalyptus grandis]